MKEKMKKAAAWSLSAALAFGTLFAEFPAAAFAAEKEVPEVVFDNTTLTEGEQTDAQTGEQSGGDTGAQTGDETGEQTGTETGEGIETGTDTETGEGTETGTETDPGTDTGSDSGGQTSKPKPKPKAKAKIKVSQPVVTMHVGKTYKVSATAKNKKTKKKMKVTWSSKNKKIATVTKSGKIKGKKRGTTYIVATAGASSKKIKVHVCLKAIDVSRWQGTIDWSKVKKSGVKMAILKATQGTGSKDPTFEYNYKHARAQGLAVGCYSYSTATNAKTAKQEARFLLNVLHGRKMTAPVVLDFESPKVLVRTNTATRMAIIKAYKDIISNAGYDFVLYCNTYWLTRCLKNSHLKNYKIWIARYNGGGTTPEYSGKGKIIMWQYGWENVPGIAGKCDYNYLY